MNAAGFSRRRKGPAPRPAPVRLGRPPFGIPIGRMVAITMTVSFAISFAVLWSGRNADTVSNSDGGGSDHESALVADGVPRGFAAIRPRGPTGAGSPPMVASGAPSDRWRPIAVTTAAAAGRLETAQEPAATATATPRVDPKLFSPAVSNLGRRPSMDGEGATTDESALAAAQATARAAAESIPSPDPALFSRAFSNQGRRPRSDGVSHNTAAAEIRE